MLKKFFNIQKNLKNFLSLKDVEINSFFNTLSIFVERFFLTMLNFEFIIRMQKVIILFQHFFSFNF